MPTIEKKEPDDGRLNPDPVVSEPGKHMRLGREQKNSRSMKNSTLLKTFSLAAVLALASTAGAQAPVQKANPYAMVPSRVMTPVKSHRAIKSSGAATSAIAKAPKRAQSQQTELINEDFSKFVNGSEDAPDTINWVANTWQGTSNDIDDNLTAKAGWTGNFVAQAGGAAGLRAPGAMYQTPAFIATPPQDYSGDVTVTFRAKRWQGYAANVNIYGYVSYDDNGGGYGEGEGSTALFRIFGGDDGWQYYTWTFKWTNSNPNSKIYLMTYDWVIIDDINVRVSADNFTAEPTVKDITNVTDSSFTINWETVRSANTYLIGLEKKVWASDEDSVSYYYDFEDGQIPSTITTTGTVEDGVGINGSKAITLADNDTITLPLNNATYKAAKLFMGVVGPEDATATDLQGSEILMFYKNGSTWRSAGYYQAPAFLNTFYDQDLLSSWYGSYANRYDGIRFVAYDFPEGYKLVLDSIAITTNRPFDFEVINEPYNFYSYGDNYNYRTREGFVDWHVSSTLDNPVNSYTVSAAALKQIDVTYDPAAEYYYTVVARRYTNNSTYTWHHAFCLPAAVATDPTDVDERGSYIANWTGPIKATRYNVTNYGVHHAAEDEANYPIIDEDFSGIDNTVTSATDPTAPESLGNDYSEESLDGYTKLPGWSGLSTTLAQGYVGCAAGYYYIPFVYTPYFQADNDTIVTLRIKAVGTAGDYLQLGFEGGNTYVVGFDSNGNIDIEGTVPESLKRTCIRISSYNYAAFMLDEFAVKQNLKKGAMVYTPLETVGIDGTAGYDTLSCSFSGLDDSYNYYAYDVTAYQDLDGSTATAEPSNRVVLDINNPDSPVVNAIQDITSVSNVNGNAIVKVVARYSIDGRQVTEGAKGLQIWKLSDGRVLKTVVK